MPAAAVHSVEENVASVLSEQRDYISHELGVLPVKLKLQE